MAALALLGLLMASSWRLGAIVGQSAARGHRPPDARGQSAAPAAPPPAAGGRAHPANGARRQRADPDHHPGHLQRQYGGIDGPAAEGGRPLSQPQADARRPGAAEIRHHPALLRGRLYPGARGHAAAGSDQGQPSDRHLRSQDREDREQQGHRRPVHHRRHHLGDHPRHGVQRIRGRIDGPRHRRPARGRRRRRSAAGQPARHHRSRPRLEAGQGFPAIGLGQQLRLEADRRMAVQRQFPVRQCARPGRALCAERHRLERLSSSPSRAASRRPSGCATSSSIPVISSATATSATPLPRWGRTGRRTTSRSGCRARC